MDTQKWSNWSNKKGTDREDTDYWTGPHVVALLAELQSE